MLNKAVGAETNSGIVVLSDNQGRPTVKIAGIIIASIILVGGGYAAYRVWQNRNASPSISHLTAQQAADEQFAKVNAAKKTAGEKTLAGANTPAEKGAAYVNLANVASAQGDPRQAYTYAQKAVAVDPTIDSYVSAGFFAEQVNDYKSAVNYYTKVVAAAKASGMQEDDYTYQTYQSMLTEAQGHLK